MKNLIVAIVASALLASCAVSHRRERRSYVEEKVEKMFKAADTDGDEWLTPAEFDAGFPWIAGKFADADTDRNGKVSLAEVTSYVELQSLQPPEKKKKK